MASWLCGENLYQAKEPAFSREQKEFLTPSVLYLPEYDEADEPPAKVLTADANYQGSYEFEYPRLSCTTFLRYRLKEDKPKHVGEDGLSYSFTDAPKKKHKPQAGLFSNKQEPLAIEHIEPEDLLDFAEAAQIIDETDGKPLSRKLEVLFEGGFNALVCDAIDEQPYVSSNINTLMHKSEEVLSGLSMIAKAAGIPNIFALCYADIDDAETVIPHKMFTIPIKRVFGRYPVRDRVKKLLAKNGRCYVFGAQALMHLYRAVTKKAVHNTTIITVAGDCVGNPRNLEVRVGTTAREVLEFCGLVKNPSRVIMGGSMRGAAVTDLDLPVLYTTRAVLAFEQPIENVVLSCISCGRCIVDCPRGLAPNYLYKQFNAHNLDALTQLRADRCIECGVCSYICPANLELLHVIKRAKTLVLEVKAQGE